MWARWVTYTVTVADGGTTAAASLPVRAFCRLLAINAPNAVGLTYTVGLRTAGQTTIFSKAGLAVNTESVVNPDGESGANHFGYPGVPVFGSDDLTLNPAVFITTSGAVTGAQAFPVQLLLIDSPG